MPSFVPEAFLNAAIEELKGAGYYRVEPQIEVRVDGDTISFASSSKIVTFNGAATILPPRANPANGLKLIDQIYQIDGAEVRAAMAIKSGSSDRYCARFRRKSSKVKEISDTHYWLSPVTAFVVTFQHTNLHSCGVEKLTGRLAGLAPEPSPEGETGRLVYKYPSASFSGQGFTWWVRWLN
jgi:hypothetical protein